VISRGGLFFSPQYANAALFAALLISFSELREPYGCASELTRTSAVLSDRNDLARRFVFQSPIRKRCAVRRALDLVLGAARTIRLCDRAHRNERRAFRSE